MVLQPASTAGKLELKKFDPGRGFGDFSQQREPVRPSQWFSIKFPRQARTYGSPFVEMREEVSGAFTKITPIALNHDFHAAALGGNKLGRVIYFEPELSFYFQDSDGVFKPTTEQKLENLFRASLMRCAEELPDTVNKLNLVVEFRSDANVRTVIRRAKSILAADQDFFSVESPNERKKGPELDERLARQFVQSALTRQPDLILTVTDAFSCYSQFLKRKDITPPKRELFKGLVAPVIREEFDLGLRNDLPGADNKQKCGWKGLKPAEVNQVLAA